MRQLLSLACSILLIACQATEQSSTSKLPPLKHPLEQDDFQFKTAFNSQFLVGTALSKEQILEDRKIQAFVAQQFNAVTAENEMKWERIHPEPSVYNWETADSLVAFSQQHHMFITGHTLVWHQQIPPWVFQDSQGNDISAETLREYLTQHIQTVVSRYKGKVQSWDVVNEALNEDGTYRESPWFKLLGPDYIELAFQLAHHIDPQAKLYYNDYNLWKPKKRQGAIRIVKKLQQQGIPIHGIGMQGHYGLKHPADLQLIEDAILAYSSLGIDVMISELDVTVLPVPDPENQGADISLNIAQQEQYNPYPNGLSQEAQQAFDKRYAEIFQILTRNSDKLHRVTFWGVHDGQSWRNYWPIEGRRDYPLLVDRQLKIKTVAKALPGANSN